MASKRNKPCYCGSGKKYKHCHLPKEESKKIQSYEADRDLRKYLSFKQCQVPDFMKSKCNNKIIKSHTVSKSSNLKQIAKDGHVYELVKTFQDVHKKENFIKLIGINNASTFLGFCSYHDKELFSPFEDQEFNFTNEQIFLLSYRALCRELYLKKRIRKFFAEKMIKEYDKGLSTPQEVNIFKEKIKTLIYGHDLAIKDLTETKEKFDIDLEKQDFRDIQYYAIIINKIPEIMSSGAWIPETDFQGNTLVDLTKEDVRFHGIFINTLTYKKDLGVIIFSWNKKDNVSENYKFIESLKNISDLDKPKAVLKWLFTCNENIFISPDWWDNLDKTSQLLLEENLKNVWSRKVRLDNYKDYNFVNWSIIDIKTNI